MLSVRTEQSSIDPREPEQEPPHEREEPVSAQPCYSARLLPAFLSVLREYPALPEKALAWIDTLDLDQRVHASAVHALLDGALRLTQDELLGIKAGLRCARGDVGLFDFILSSAATLRSALESARRYLRLLNDAVELDLQVVEARAIVSIDSRVVLPAVAEDFLLVGLLINQAASWPDGVLDDLDVWFRHAPPSTPEVMAGYSQALGPARLHFRAPRTGFGLPAAMLDAPLKSRDEKLHALLCHYGDASLASLPQPETVTEKVRRVIAEQLTAGTFGLHDTAKKLGMSARTLGRRLTAEGTTFKDLVDEARRELALRYVASQELDLSEIALRAGFTETPSFYRAFRRWTGTTPSRYRWLHRSESMPNLPPRTLKSSRPS